MTNNQYYGGLNRRFEKRARLLRKLGWVYTICELYPVGLFTRRSWCPNKQRAIPAAVLHYADNRAWHDVLATELRRAS